MKNFSDFIINEDKQHTLEKFLFKKTQPVLKELKEELHKSVKYIENEIDKLFLFNNEEIDIQPYIDNIVHIVYNTKSIAYYFKDVLKNGEISEYNGDIKKLSLEYKFFKRALDDIKKELQNK